MAILYRTTAAAPTRARDRLEWLPAARRRDLVLPWRSRVLSRTGQRLRSPLARPLLAPGRDMDRVMVLLRGPIDLEAVRRCCAIDLTQPYEVAICRILPDGHDSIQESIQAQRDVTSALRRLLGAGAEAFAVFVAPEREVDEYARLWGATVVLR